MKLTIFTPTYNRIEELPGLYQSIKKSLENIAAEDFVEWLIVDDGSKVDISSCVNGFSATPQMEIRYIRKENGGKHTAFNVAIENADSDIFVCIDDDDRLTENALKDIFYIAKRYAAQDIGGIVGRVVDEHGNLLGKTIFDDVLVSNTIEIRDRYHFWGEPEVFYTDILKNYRFQEFSGEKFLTEAFLFDQMSLAAPFVYTNTPLMVKKYLPGGLTDNATKIRMRSPLGSEAYYYQRKQLSRGFFHKLKATINRQRFVRYASQRPKRKIDILELIAMPVAAMMAMRDQHLYHKSKGRS